MHPVVAVVATNAPRRAVNLANNFILSSFRIFCNYYILPYALSGTIDVYGRYKKITPLPFNGTAKDEKDAWIVGLYRYPVYNIDKEEEFDKENSCVLLHDYAKQISQTVLPRSSLQEPLLNLMSEAFPMARTSLLANSGIQGMRVSSEDEGMNVAAAGQAIATCALRGQIWAPIIGAPGLEELTGKGTANQAEEYRNSINTQNYDLIRMKYIVTVENL